MLSSLVHDAGAESAEKRLVGGGASFTEADTRDGPKRMGWVWTSRDEGKGVLNKGISGVGEARGHVGL